ncbi:hypothetical protein DFH06DRAFT_985484 [Mycena polygramma]|nr:hypothetical protein DFH06DRAFT_985484 [Mycena polygramma]
MIPLLYPAHTLIPAHPVAGHSLQPRDSVVSCDDVRTLFSIISGCLATIFACTWVSVHPNIPPPNQGRLALFSRRLGLMLVAAIAPELMVGFAARQFLDAHWFSKKYAVSKLHGFFFTAGGFVSPSGHHPIVTEKQLQLDPEYICAIRSIPVHEIKDKSKGDALSKSIVLLQGLWFTAQCIARVHQNLPVTELEVTTIAFQFVNIFIWLLWWHKPLDVQRPISLGPGEEYLEDNVRRVSWIRSMKAAGEGLVVGTFPMFDPASATSVPAFWSPICSRHEGGDKQRTSGLFAALIGTIFGFIHCLAWLAHFPSAREMLMWRVCSVVVAAIPLALVLVLCLLWALVSSLEQKTRLLAIKITCYLTLPIYVLARIILITLAFTTLRALPPGAFMDVDWSVYIPHTGV